MKSADIAKRWRESVLSAVETAVSQTADNLHASMLSDILSGEKSGRIYIREGGRVHQASAGGEAPASDTGNLVNTSRIEKQRFVADVVFPAPYAIHLEYGTERMEARPFARPAIERERGKTAGTAARLI